MEHTLTPPQAGGGLEGELRRQELAELLELLLRRREEPRVGPLPPELPAEARIALAEVLSGELRAYGEDGLPASDEIGSETTPEADAPSPAGGGGSEGGGE